VDESIYCKTCLEENITTVASPLADREIEPDFEMTELKKARESKEEFKEPEDEEIVEDITTARQKGKGPRRQSVIPPNQKPFELKQRKMSIQPSFSQQSKLSSFDNPPSMPLPATPPHRRSDVAPGQSTIVTSPSSSSDIGSVASSLSKTPVPDDRNSPVNCV
jgi:hypothetical protein